MANKLGSRQLAEIQKMGASQDRTVIASNSSEVHVSLEKRGLVIHCGTGLWKLTEQGVTVYEFMRPKGTIDAPRFAVDDKVVIEGRDEIETVIEVIPAPNKNTYLYQLSGWPQAFWQEELNHAPVADLLSTTAYPEITPGEAVEYFGDDTPEPMEEEPTPILIDVDEIISGIPGELEPGFSTHSPEPDPTPVIRINSIVKINCKPHLNRQGRVISITTFGAFRILLNGNEGERAETPAYHREALTVIPPQLGIIDDGKIYSPVNRKRICAEHSYAVRPPGGRIANQLLTGDAFTQDGKAMPYAVYDAITGHRINS